MKNKLKNGSIKSFLFVPADRPERFKKAIDSQANAIIIDLEDSVNDEQKAVGRDNIVKFDESNEPFWVRCNASNSLHFVEDMKCLEGLANLSGVVVPKAEDVTALHDVFVRLNKPIMIAIETLVGLDCVKSLAKVDGVCAVSFGVLDLARAFGVAVGTSGAVSVFNAIRFEILRACRLADVVAIESIFSDFQDMAGFVSHANFAYQMGFGGQLCIHPNQVRLANMAYAPSDEQKAFATSVLAEYEKTGNIAFGLHGIMVDLPVILWAKDLLKEAKDE